MEKRRERREQVTIGDKLLVLLSLQKVGEIDEFYRPTHTWESAAAAAKVPKTNLVRWSSEAPGWFQSLRARELSVSAMRVPGGGRMSDQPDAESATKAWFLAERALSKLVTKASLEDHLQEACVDAPDIHP